jgi:hypothetical protein
LGREVRTLIHVNAISLFVKLMLFHRC